MELYKIIVHNTADLSVVFDSTNGNECENIKVFIFCGQIRGTRYNPADHRCSTDYSLRNIALKGGEAYFNKVYQFY